jgi:hypothetical protein
MSKEKTIKDLVNHYVKTYKINTYASSSNQYTNDGLGTYITAITRIMQNTKIADKSLWDITKGDNGPRKISIEDFEKYCFPKWAAYLMNNCGLKDSEEFKEYINEHLKSVNLAYWNTEAKKTIENYPDILAKIDPEEELEALRFPDPSVSISDLRKKGHEFMLEAIYAVFYEPFKWDELYIDMENESYSQLEDVSNITGEQMKSIDRLKNYLHYIGDKSQR